SLEMPADAIAGDKVPAEVEIANQGTQAIPTGEVSLTVPEDWSIDKETIEIPSIDPGKTYTTETEIEIPIHAASDKFPIKAIFQTEDGKIKTKQKISVQSAVTLKDIDKVMLGSEDSGQMEATLVNNRKENTTDDFVVELPDGWTIKPEKQSFNLASEEEQTFTIEVTPPTDYSGVKELSVNALIEDKEVSSTNATFIVKGMYVSDLDWVKAENGWGAVARDMSN